MILCKIISQKKTVIKIILFILIFIAILTTKSNAAEKFGDFYELNNNIITRILPETTLTDFRNNLENDNIVVIKGDGKMLTNNEFVGTGMIARINSDVYFLSVLADLDGNGKVTITDLIMHQTYINRLRTLETKGYLSADINNNNKVTLTDLVQMFLVTVRVKDIIAPESYLPVKVVSNKTITVVGSTMDKGVGVKEYAFKLDGGKWVQNADKTASTYTFSNVDTTKEHRIYVMVTDKAGNKKKNKAIQIEEEQKEGIFVKLYTDGTLAFTSTDRLLPGKVLKVDYGNIIDKNFGEHTEPWVKETVTTVNFADVIHPKTTANWFALCHKLTKIQNIENLDTSNVTNMSHMFCQCIGLEFIDLQSFDTSKVTNMEYMFNSCSGTKFINCRSFDTSNVTTMYRMFYYCKSLQSVNVTGFDTTKVKTMDYMFGECENLTILDLRSFDTTRGTTMVGMFKNCKSMEKILASTKWKTVGVISNVFSGCSIRGVTLK